MSKFKVGDVVTSVGYSEIWKGSEVVKIHKLGPTSSSSFIAQKFPIEVRTKDGKHMGLFAENELEHYNG